MIYYYYTAIAHDIYSLYKDDFISHKTPFYQPRRKKLKGYEKNRK